MLVGLLRYEFYRKPKRLDTEKKVFSGKNFIFQVVWIVI